MTLTGSPPPPPALPSREDPVVRGASTVIGGPVGRHAALGGGRRSGVAVWAVLALTCVTLALGWVQKAPCRTHPWTAQYQYTRMCYSDVFALDYAEKLVEGKTT